MEFQKICKKYFNRYINTAELLSALKELDITKLSEAEQTSFSALIISIESIQRETTDEPDELVKTELIKLQESIDQVENIVKKSKKVPQELRDHLKELKAGIKRPRDNFERWSKVSDAISQNKYFQDTFDALSDIEFLELIAEDIKAPRPAQIDSDKFNALVQAGKDADKREWLWRLALNYHEQDFNHQQIADYYIAQKDLWYLTELISAVGDKLNIQAILDQLDTENAIKYFLESRPIISQYVTNA
jgi:hypothetical protein